MQRKGTDELETTIGHGHILDVSGRLSTTILRGFDSFSGHRGNDTSFPSITTEKTSPIQYNPRPSTHDSVKTSRSSFNTDNDERSSKVDRSITMANRLISPTSPHGGLELPDVAAGTSRLSTRSSFKSTDNDGKSGRAARSSFIFDHCGRDDMPTIGHSHASLNESIKSTRSSFDRSSRVSRSSFNLSDSNHGSNTPTRAFNMSDSIHGLNNPTRGLDNVGHSRPSLNESIKSTRSSFDKSSRVSRSSFTSDSDTSSRSVTSENNPSLSPSQKRTARPSTRDSNNKSTLSSFKDSDSAKRLRDSVARSLLDESESDFCRSMGDDEWPIREYIDAVLNGHLGIVKNSLELHKIDPNTLQADDFNALFAASGEGHLSVVNYLLSKGSCVNFVAPLSQYSPLHAAAVDGHVEVLEALLDEGAHINCTNINGWTPLWKACRSGQVETVQLLIDRGANIELADLLGMTALHVACKDGYFDIVKLLLDRGAKVNVLTQSGETPFFLCATSSDWVAEQGNLTCLLILKEFGADIDRPDFQGKTPEATAGELLQPFFRLCHLTSNDPECLDLLKDDEYHLWFALISANCKSVFLQELIKLYPSLEDCRDARGRLAYDVASPPMKEAFSHSSFQALFLSQLQLSTKSNSNPLHVTDEAADEFMTQWSTKTPAEKETELRTLARDGELTKSQLAMMKDTDLNCVDSYGWTPLYEAIHHGHLQVAKLLVMEGADVDITDEAGWSPVYLAAYYDHLDIVQFLTVQGCDIEQTDKKGKKPIDVAQSSEISNFLKNAPEEIRKIKREERLAEHRARHRLPTGDKDFKDGEFPGFSINPLTNSSKLSVHHYRSSRKDGNTTSSKGLSTTSRKEGSNTSRKEGSTTSSKMSDQSMNSSSSSPAGVVVVVDAEPSPEPDQRTPPTQSPTTKGGSLPRLVSMSLTQEGVSDGSYVPSTEPSGGAAAAAAAGTPRLLLSLSPSVLAQAQHTPAASSLPIGKP